MYCHKNKSVRIFLYSIYIKYLVLVKANTTEYLRLLKIKVILFSMTLRVILFIYLLFHSITTVKVSKTSI